MNEKPLRLFKLAKGKLTPWDTDANCLRAAAEQMPSGSYTTLRTYQGDRFLRLDAHLDRLEQSASLAGSPIPIDRPAIRRALAQAISQAGHAESRLRLTLTLEPTSGGSNRCPAEKGDVFIALEPFYGFEPNLYAEGARCLTVSLRRQRPRAKMNDFFGPSRQVYASLPAGIHEGLMTDENDAILEGLTSNFFAVYQETLWTAQDGVLPGVTRGLVLEIAADVLPIRLEAVRLAQISGSSEAFITSSSREVMPVIEIDGTLVGDARPGSKTQELLCRYRACLAQEVTPAV